MASTAETITDYPYLEVPDINQTSFYNAYGTGIIRLNEGLFYRTRIDLVTRFNLGNEKAKEFDSSQKAVGLVDRLSGFSGQSDYRNALRDFDTGRRHLLNTQGNISSEGLGAFIKEVKQKRLKDFQKQADEATLAIQSLQLKPWAVLSRKFLPQSGFEIDYSTETNKHWLAPIVGIEVMFDKEGDPVPGARVEDQNGQVGLVPPDLHQVGVVIQI